MYSFMLIELWNNARRWVSYQTALATVTTIQMLIGLLRQSTRVSRVYQQGRLSCSCDSHQGLPSLGSQKRLAKECPRYDWVFMTMTNLSAKGQEEKWLWNV